MSKIFHTHGSQKGKVFGGMRSLLRLKRKAEVEAWIEADAS